MQSYERNRKVAIEQANEGLRLKQAQLVKHYETCNKIVKDLANDAQKDSAMKYEKAWKLEQALIQNMISAGMKLTV